MNLIIKKHLNKDYCLFQQDPILNGLDELQQLKQNDDVSDSFVTKPAKIGETITCRITSLNRVFTEYMLILESNQGYSIPLLVSKKSKLSMTPVYLIQEYENFMLQNNISIATLEGGLISTNFIMYETLNSDNEQHYATGETQITKISSRNQLLRIDYDSYIKNIGIPIRMKVYLPGIDEYFNYYKIKLFDNLTNEDNYKLQENNDFAENFESKKFIKIESEFNNDNFPIKYNNKAANINIFNKEIVKLYTKPPFYDQINNVYKLKMSNRVKLSSVLNFQLINEANQDYIVLQCGRLDKDTFTCDFSYPLNALQAFGIVLSRLHKMDFFHQ